ncbi:MAG: hypothetical protein QOE58_258 [Actinomycetota bacterium]|jgi:MFS family permease|nr:hypothetical protein [Actinomycetota bacterium]
MIVAPIAGLIAPRVGVRVLLRTGLTLQAVGLAWLALEVGPSTPYTDLLPGFILAGIGMGLTFAPSATAALADMAPDDHATASSTNSTIREIGVALGVAVLVAVFRANGGTLTPAGYNAGLRTAILTGGAVVALGALSTIWLPRTTATRPSHPRHPADRRKRRGQKDPWATAMAVRSKAARSVAGYNDTQPATSRANTSPVATDAMMAAGPDGTSSQAIATARVSAPASPSAHSTADTRKRFIKVRLKSRESSLPGLPNYRIMTAKDHRVRRI